MRFDELKICEDYTARERSSFVFHTLLALASVPLNFINGYAGLLALPYLLFLTLRPKSQYLLPIIIILAYSSPLRLFFCTACFFYVLFHMNQLRRYGLFGVWWLYLCLSPFFIWYFYQKTQMVSYLVGVGDLASGFGTYFMFACAFWAVLCIRRMGTTFLKGLFYWSLFLVFLVSFVGVERDATMAEDAGKGLFTRQVFLAIPICAATFSYFILRKSRELRKIGLLAGLACLVLALDFLKILHYDLTFTCIGLMILSFFFVFITIRMPNLCRRLNPLVFFVASCVIVLLSPMLVERYRNINAGMGSYSELKVTDFNSLMIKLQRKAVDDRASVWAFNIESIREQMHRNPIWIDVKPFAEAVTYEEGKGWVEGVMLMDAHNTMLHLLRHFGFYGGLGLYLFFLWYFCRKENRRILTKSHNATVVVVLSVCMAHGIIGGHTGHYPVTLAFGPVFYALLGGCWRAGAESLKYEGIVA